MCSPQSLLDECLERIIALILRGTFVVAIIQQPLAQPAGRDARADQLGVDAAQRRRQLVRAGHRPLAAHVRAAHEAHRVHAVGVVALDAVLARFPHVADPDSAEFRHQVKALAGGRGIDDHRATVR